MPLSILDVALSAPEGGGHNVIIGFKFDLFIGTKILTPCHKKDTAFVSCCTAKVQSIVHAITGRPAIVPLLTTWQMGLEVSSAFMKLRQWL